MDSVPPSEGGYSGSIPDMGIRALQHGALFLCRLYKQKRKAVDTQHRNAGDNGDTHEAEA